VQTNQRGKKMTTVNGRIAWGEKGAGAGGGASKLDQKNDFLRLKSDGDYIIQLMSEAPMAYHEHWSKTTDGQNRSLRCALRNCTLCKEADAAKNSPDPKQKEAAKQMMAKPKYAIEAYLLAQGNERLGQSTGRAVIFEFGKQVYEGISQVAKTLEKIGGQLTGSILLINRDARRGPSGMYSVTLVPTQYKMNQAQLDSVKAFEEKSIDLSKLYAPPEDEANMRRLGRLGGPTDGPMPAASFTGQAPNQAAGGAKWDDSW
jgi:hypothetical protein